MKRLRYLCLKFRILFITLALVFLLSPVWIFSDTVIPHNSDIFGTWTLEDSPYLVEGTATINEGDELVVEPGVLVRFNGSGGAGSLNVYGKLTAVGTEQDTIRFTISNQGYFWYGIEFSETSDPSSILDYCSISQYTSFKVYSDVTISNSKISANGYTYDGIDCYNAAPLITNNEIFANFVGIGLFEGSNAEISYNHIHDHWGNDAPPGAIYARDSSPYIHHNFFELNDDFDILLYECNDVIIEHNISDNGALLDIYGGSGIVIRYNEFLNSQNPMFIRNSDPIFHNNRFENLNVIEINNGNALFYKNLFISNQYAIHDMASCSTILNNTFYDNYNSILVDVSRTNIINNIIYQTNSYPCINYDSPSNPVSMYNCLYSEDSSYYGFDFIHIDDIYQDPQFADFDSFELSLDSPCRNSGYEADYYEDNDGLRNTIGYTGGSISGVIPSYPEHDFQTIVSGEVGFKEFVLYNLSDELFSNFELNIDNENFSITPISELEIAANNSLRFDLTLFSQTEGEHNAQISINSDSFLNGETIPIQGNVNSQNGTSLNNITISEDTIWNIENSPYYLSGEIIVESGVCLQIDPGVEIYINPYFAWEQTNDDPVVGRILVYGQVIANGTDINPILFTRNEAAMDWNSIGYWGGIHFLNSDDPSEFNYTKIEYGWGDFHEINLPYYSQNIGPALFSFGTDLTLNNCEIKNNHCGLLVYESGLTLNNSSFENNGTQSIHFINSAYGEISNTYFSNTNVEAICARNSDDIIIDSCIFENCVNTLKNIESIININRSIFYANSVVLWGNTGENIFINCDLVSNDAVTQWNAPVIYVNCIIYDNDNMDSEYDFNETKAYNTFFDLDVLDNLISHENCFISENPMFVSLFNDDFNLLPESPCIDVGTAFLEVDDHLLIDLHENEYFGDYPDLGAIEFRDDSSISGDVTVNGTQPGYELSVAIVTSEEDWEPGDDVEYQEVNTNPDGGYIFDNIVPGEYYVYAYYSNIPQTYYRQNSDIPCFSWENSTTIVIEENMTVSNININLVQPLQRGGFTLSGNINSINQQATENVSIVLINSDGNVEDFGYSNEDGFYQVEYLLEGEYELVITKIFYETYTENIILNENTIHNVIYYQPIENDDEITEYKKLIACNYPNPFFIKSNDRNSQLTISFETFKESFVEVNIYNIKGQFIKNICSDKFTKGSHEVSWNGKDRNENFVGSGVYFYQLVRDQEVYNGKILLLK